MRIDRLHPFHREVDVYLSGERLRTCLWADDIEGIAEVALTDKNGLPLQDGRGLLNTITEIRKGRVRFEPHQGQEERFNHFQIGWAYGRDETLEKLKGHIRHADDCTHWIPSPQVSPCSCGLTAALKGLEELPDA